MAIYGNLSDFSLRDILNVIGDKRGVLTVDQRDGQVLRLQVAESNVTRMSVERPVDSRTEAQLLLRLFGQDRGVFRFEAGEVESPHHSFLRLGEVLGTRAGDSLDERDLPHPKTVFLLIKARQVSLPADLDEFLGAAESLLATGASAERLADALGVPVDQARHNLQRLREVKKVWPMQAHVDRLDADQRQQRRSLGQRIASFFSR
nr:DUF4388 domain-containing protein [Pseudoxanthomonas sp.]